MIETRAYSTPKDFDKKSIRDNDFYRKLIELESLSRIKIVQSPVDGKKPYILYLNQGLCAEVTEDTYPVIIHGSDQLSFEGGINLLEELLQTKLTESSTTKK
jgi:hypothetical protein